MLFLITFALLSSVAWTYPLEIPSELPKLNFPDWKFDPQVNSHVISLEVPPESTDIDESVENKVKPVEDGDLSELTNQTWAVPLQVQPELAILSDDKSLDKSIDKIVNKISQADIGIKGWDTLKLDHCEPVKPDGQFTCEAVIDEALLNDDFGKEEKLSLKIEIIGQIKDGKLDNLGLTNAQPKQLGQSSHQIALISRWTDWRDKFEDAIGGAAIGAAACAFGVCG